MAYASLVIIFNKKNEVLLLKRSEKVDSFRGLWGFPGGKREDGELSLEAAVREVKEETDLDILKKDYNTDVTAHELENIVLDYDTHDTLSKKYGVSKDVIYVAKSMFR